MFFASDHEWQQARENEQFDYVVIGSGFCALAFVDQILRQAAEKPPRILVLERGSFFLPEHFQNLPVAFKATLPDQRYMSETYPWTVAKESTDPAQLKALAAAAAMLGGLGN